MTRPARRRRDVVLTLVLLAAATLVAATPTWVRATGATALSQEVDVTVSGSTAAPGVSAAALVVVAAALALGLVGRIGRWLVLVVVALGGAVVVAGGVGVIASPDRPARSAVAEVTGTSETTSAVSLTAAPYVSVVLGVGILLAVLWALLARVDWSRRVQRYEAPASQAQVAAGAVAPARPQRSGRAGATAAPDRDEAPIDERAAWDALSHGDDPS